MSSCDDAFPWVFRMQDVAYRYDKTTAFQVSELTLPPASITGLAGPNGSGKTTFLKLLAGILSPTCGTVWFYGPPKVRAGHPSVRRQVSLLTQTPYLLKRSVFENVAYGLRIRRQTGALPDQVAKALNRVGLNPEKFMRRSWNTLSGGEAQRVALAARLVLKPRALLLDEPTASVDRQSAGQIHQAVFKAREKWHTALVVTAHDHNWLYDICDQVLHFQKGCVVGKGPVSILDGPFQPAADGRAVWKLSDGQTIRLAVLPPSDKMLTIAAEKISWRPLENPPPGRFGQNQLRGLVRQTHWLANARQCLVTVQIAEFCLNLAVAGDAGRPKICAGQRIWVCFNGGDIDWVSLDHRFGH